MVRHPGESRDPGTSCGVVLLSYDGIEELSRAARILITDLLLFPVPGLRRDDGQNNVDIEYELHSPASLATRYRAS